MTTDQTITLVTGANKGIGREIARQLAELGHTVVIGARSQERGEQAAAELNEAGGRTGGEVTSLVLDVNDPDSADAAAANIEERYGRLDVLVNNAGVSHLPDEEPYGKLPREREIEAVRYCFETNVFGTVIVTQAMLPLLARAEVPRIVNVSSSAGSLTLMSKHDGPTNLAYPPSKTAMTALTMQYAKQLAGDGVKVNAVCPGFVATDLNGHAGHRTPEQGAHRAVAMATIGADGPTGTFTDEDGTVPW